MVTSPSTNIGEGELPRYMAGGRDGEANSLVLKPGMSLEEAEKLLMVEIPPARDLKPGTGCQSLGDQPASAPGREAAALRFAGGARDPRVSNNCTL